jgi:hypothetical protein
MWHFYTPYPGWYAPYAAWYPPPAYYGYRPIAPGVVAAPLAYWP